MVKRAIGRFAGLAAFVASTACVSEQEFNVPPSLALSSVSVTANGILDGPPVSQPVTIVNGTDGTLTGLSATVHYTGTPGRSWLTATFDKTTATREAAATLQLRADPTGFALGSQDATVDVSAEGAPNSPVRIAVKLLVKPRPPAKISIVTQPSAQAVNGVALAVQPVVQLLNDRDQPVAAETPLVITAGVGSGGGQVTGGVTAATDASGRAVFTGLALTGLVGPRTIQFTATGLAAATSQSITLAAGAATQLVAVSGLTQSGIL